MAKAPLRKFVRDGLISEIMKNLSTDFNTIYLNIHLRNQEKVPKTHDQQHIASLHAGVGGAVSNDDCAFELYPSDPEASESEELAYASAGIISLDVGGGDKTML